MSNKNKIYGIYLPVLYLALAIVITLRTIALITNLEPSGYFSNSILTDISNVIVLFVSLFFLTYLFTARKDMRFIPSFSSALSYGPSAIVGASLFFIGFFLIRSGIKSENIDFLNKYSIILGIVAILAISYFVASGLSVKRRSIKRADFGLIVLVFMCMYIIYIFFDRTTPINTPAKIVANTVVNTDRKIEYTNETTLAEDDPQIAYFNVDANDATLEFTITALRKSDNQVKNYTKTITLQKQSWHQVTVKAATSQGSADITINIDESIATVEHEVEVDPYN